MHILQTMLVFAILAGGVVLFEVLARKTKIPATLIRKCIHVGMALLTVAVAWIFDYHMMVAIGLLFTVLFLVARRLYQFRSLRDRKGESWGEIFFPLGLAASAFVAPTVGVYIAAALVLGLSDTAAYYIGKAFPKAWRIIKGRTVAGSGAGFIVTGLIVLLCEFSPLIALAVAAAVTFFEIISKNGADNFTMPVAASLVLAMFVG